MCVLQDYVNSGPGPGLLFLTRNHHTTRGFVSIRVRGPGINRAAPFCPVYSKAAARPIGLIPPPTSQYQRFCLRSLRFGVINVSTANSGTEKPMIIDSIENTTLAAPAESRTGKRKPQESQGREVCMWFLAGYYLQCGLPRLVSQGPSIPTFRVKLKEISNFCIFALIRVNRPRPILPTFTNL